MMRRLSIPLVRKTQGLLLSSQGNSLGECIHSAAQRPYGSMNGKLQRKGYGRSLFLRTHTTLSNSDESSVAEVKKSAGEFGKAESGQANLLKLFAVVNGQRDAIKIADTEDVAALREAIKNKFAVTLANYDAASLVLKLSADAKALDPEATLRDVLIDAKGKPIKHVYVELPANQLATPGVSYWWQSYEDTQDELDWKPNSAATAFLNELLSSAPEKINIPGEDDEGKPIVDGVLEVTKLHSFLQTDEQATSSNMVLPQSTRDMWEVVLDGTKKYKPQQRVIVVGSPGLGKSRSINYFIKSVIKRRSSHDNKRPMPVVVFEHRKDGLVYLFAPDDPSNKNTEYKAFSLDRTKFSAKSSAVVNNPDNYYIVDTSQAERAKMPSLVFAVTIYVCSPDPRHYSEFEKHAGGFKIFCPAWRPQDIMAAREFMANPPLKEDEVRARMDVVGPIPRRVFAEENVYQGFKTRIDEALRDHQDDIERVLIGGSSALETSTQHDQKPRSSVFMFGVYEKNFLQPTVHFVSDYARRKVSVNILKKVLTDIAFRDPARSVEYGKIFEQVCFAALDSGWRGTLVPIPIMNSVAVDTSKELVKLKNENPPQKGSGVKLVESGTGLSKRVYDLMKAMKFLPETSIPVYFASNFPLFDAADARNRGWNVTLAKKKSVTVRTVTTVREGLGLSSNQLLHIVYLMPKNSEFSLNLNGKEKELSQLVKLFKMELPSLSNSEAWEMIASKGSS